MSGIYYVLIITYQWPCGLVVMMLCMTVVLMLSLRSLVQYLCDATGAINFSNFHFGSDTEFHGDTEFNEMSMSDSVSPSDTDI